MDKIISIRQRLAEYPRALTAADLSSILAVSEELVQKRARRGLIPSFRIGTAVRFCPKAVSDWLEGQ